MRCPRLSAGFGRSGDGLVAAPLRVQRRQGGGEHAYLLSVPPVPRRTRASRPCRSSRVERSGGRDRRTPSRGRPQTRSSHAADAAVPWFRTVHAGSVTVPSGATVVGVTINVAGAETTRSTGMAYGRVMVLLVPKVTAPFRAKALPSMVAL